jgi:dihydropyrimidinase
MANCASHTILIKGGKIVREEGVFLEDLLIRGERIAEIEGFPEHEIHEVVDASGLLIFPGAVDTHVHLNDVFMNTVSVHDYYTGTLAAAFGGVTSVIDFSNQRHGDPLVNTIEDKKSEAAGRALIDWGVHPVITDPSPSTLKEILDVVEMGSPTIKCYMTYREEGLLIGNEDLELISESLCAAGGMLLLHQEDNEMAEAGIRRELDLGGFSPLHHALSKPTEVEDAAIRTAIDITRRTKGRTFIVHLTSSDGLEMITAAKDQGVDIHTETCTHYLLFTDEELKREDGVKWICSPPLRDAANQKLLWSAVSDGRIPMVTSDDAAYSWEAKQYGKDRFDRCPNGIPGVESRFISLYSEGVVAGKLTLEAFVKAVSCTPAKIFGLWPKKGNLLPGADADIVLLDPTESWEMNRDTLHMSTDWSVFDNQKTTGRIKKVYSRGELIIDGENCVGDPGRGQYLHRKLPDHLQY